MHRARAQGEAVPGVSGVAVNLATGRATLDLAPDNDPTALAEAVGSRPRPRG
ncbi:heavy-metal-associated domain-containing protein [Methylobacterium nodulans]|uniref:heavy-metal-associated domain-containing protein n=1 Tax=Methylobacterium nodulans TaxID=114616 RepID=UPI001FCC2AC7|nr:heavy metal-associated domain-containing protein [Methylobacterium nodulans]